MRPGQCPTGCSEIGVNDSAIYHDPPFHSWFELTYSHYLVLPRSLLEAMPHDWQDKMIALLNEMRATFDHDMLYMVQRRDEETGKFIQDPLANYRHPPELPWRKAKGDEQA